MPPPFSPDIARFTIGIMLYPFLGLIYFSFTQIPQLAELGSWAPVLATFLFATFALAPVSYIIKDVQHPFTLIVFMGTYMSLVAGIQTCKSILNKLGELEVLTAIIVVLLDSWLLIMLMMVSYEILHLFDLYLFLFFHQMIYPGESDTTWFLLWHQLLVNIYKDLASICGVVVSICWSILEAFFVQVANTGISALEQHQHEDEALAPEPQDDVRPPSYELVCYYQFSNHW